MKIGIVGCGMVGSTSAYALVMRGVGALATIPLPLDDSEQAALRRSADIVRQAIEWLNLN